MYTSILLVAMAGTQSPFATPTPDWKQDYAEASREGKAARKPLAVFVGRGTDGWSQVSDTGRLGPDVRGLLGEKYVCVYVDRTTEDGRQLARDLGVSRAGPGLVISDVTGDLQAFRHSGKLSPARLTRYLRTFSDPNRVVKRTEVPARTDVRFYPPATSGGAGRSAGTIVPRGGFMSGGGC
jgi:hypothetical protein